MIGQTLVWLKRACWLVVVGFWAWSLFAAVSIHSLFRLARNGTLVCGNSITEVLFPCVNIGVPSAVAATIGLVLLARRGIGRPLRVALASIAVLVTAVGLVGFGLWFHAVPLEGHWSFADGVWWMLRL
jgi:hypothetical protein